MKTEFLKTFGFRHKSGEFIRKTFKIEAETEDEAEKVFTIMARLYSERIDGGKSIDAVKRMKSIGRH